MKRPTRWYAGQQEKQIAKDLEGKKVANSGATATNNKNATRYYSSRQEKGIAKDIGGRVVANSGAPKFIAGDITTEQFLVEAKTHITNKQSFSIKKEWLIKNKKEAFAMNKPYNALAFNFGPNEENYYIIDSKLFKELKNFLEKS